MNAMSDPATERNSSFRHLVAACIILFAVPLLIFVGLVPFDWRMYLLTLTGGGFIFWAKCLNLTKEDLGLSSTTFIPAMRSQLWVIGAFLALLLIAPYIGLTERFEQPNATFFLFYVFVSCPIQEFIYRSFLFSMCKRSEFNMVATCAILTVPYAWVHVIYRDWLTLLFTLVIGAFWASTYQRQPNLAAVSISHAVLGVTTLLLGMV